jgi:hypothetical protein
MALDSSLPYGYRDESVLTTQPQPNLQARETVDADNIFLGMYYYQCKQYGTLSRFCPAAANWQIGRQQRGLLSFISVPCKLRFVPSFSSYEKGQVLQWLGGYRIRVPEC